MAERSDRRAFGFIGLAASLAALPVVLLPWVPMTDLPQHAAQLATWKALSDPASPLHGWVRVDWRTPSVFMAIAARALHTFLPASLSLRVIAAVAMVGLPLATAWLLRRAGRPPAWALLTVTLGYGYSFSWGFLAFLVGAPLVLLLLGRALPADDSPVPPSRAPWMTLALSSLLLLSHALLLCFALALVLPFVLRPPGTMRERLVRLLPFVAPLPLGVLWAAWTFWVEPVAAEPPRFGLGWTRIGHMLLAISGQPKGLTGLVFGAAWLAAPLFAAGSLATGWLRWWPCFVCAALALLGPSVLLGCAWLPGRWTAFLLPLLLFAVAPPPAGSRRARLALPGFALMAATHLALQVPRMVAFGQDAAEIVPLLSAMAPNRRVLFVPLDAETPYLPGAPFLHHGQWYAVERGGVVDFSFASYYVLLVRYRREVGEVLAPGFPWNPERFIDKARSLGPHDYYLVRAEEDPAPRLFPRGDVTLLMQSGRYLLYRPIAP